MSVIARAGARSNPVRNTLPPLDCFTAFAMTLKLAVPIFYTGLMLRRPAPFLLLALALSACAPRVAERAAPLPPPPLPPQPVRAVPVDFVLVEKAQRRLTLYGQGRLLKSYGGLQYGDDPVGHKRFEGDERTPEGRYVLDYPKPRSTNHLSLHISYPNARDRAFAARYGRSPGGLIFIHGQPNALGDGRVAGDWTDGCIALSNAQIEEIWDLVPDGTPIEIRP